MSCVQPSQTLLLAPKLLQPWHADNVTEWWKKGEGKKAGGGGENVGEKNPIHTRRQTRNLRTSSGRKYVRNKNYIFLDVKL